MQQPAPALTASGENRSAAWGSDVIAEALAATGIRHIALTPGSSFRGLHDSLVNHLGAQCPGVVLCLHEEHSVALAHGYAKVTGQPMAVAVHANVGLMHATMALYNAWCDRVPMLVLGATGPVDAARRRPWIDWIHTAADQGMLIRPYVKWDDQPASVEASVAAVWQADQITRTSPPAPVYVCLDVSVQEEPVAAGAVTSVPRTGRIPDPWPGAAEVALAADRLARAQRPLILMGRVGRGEDQWRDRIALAERLNASVITDGKVAAAFPTRHPLHVGVPSLFLTPEQSERLRAADVVLALDWVDLAGTLRAVGASGHSVISATVDHHLHRGWSKDAFGPVPSEVNLPCPADRAVEALLGALPAGRSSRGLPTGPARSDTPMAEPDGRAITVPALAAALHRATRGTNPCLIRTPLSWDARQWPVEGPLDALGYDGGAGVGSGPGMAVGAALALRGTGRLPVAVLGDGDVLMGGTALWTAAKHDIPLLVVVANNASFHNDEVHQRTVAQTRGRAVENATVGVALDEPTADLATFARSLGLTGIGPITDAHELPAALGLAVRSVREGARVLVDVRVAPGDTPARTSALTEG
jgi:thiamine pyrophosphate-dependent acetolactate synthase large subunit-like protein